MKLYFTLAIVLLAAGSAIGDKADRQAMALADRYYGKYIETFPETAYARDIALTRHDQVSSNNLKEIKKWENFEDSLYGALSKINESGLKEKKSKVAYWLLKEELESSMAMRVCKRNLWNINHTGGWHHTWAQLAKFQPVGSAQLRKEAIERWSKLPAFISTEIQNLRTGAAQGYTMPKEIVQLVIGQFQVLLSYKVEASPFYSPASRENDSAFKEQWVNLLTTKVLPAMAEYQGFLKTEYLAKARSNASILANPNGGECYQAYVRMRTTTTKTGQEIFALGQSIVNANKITVEKLGGELYGTTDFTEIIKRVKADSADYFKTSEEILAYNTVSMAEARKVSLDWFSLLPSTEVTIKPYEAYESGVGAYERATKNKAAFYRINLKDPGSQQKGDNEKLTFHEAYPGHHLQRGIEQDFKDVHPISKLTYFGSYSEGWGRYSEELAEEMSLYKTKTALILRRAWPSRGMVVDPGIHLKGWTKSEAIDYMIQAGQSEYDALNLYYRILAFPAQLTSYDVGGEEIKSLRKLSKERLGKAFDIKEFHTKILENGSIPLGSLRSQITAWLETKTR